MLGCSLITNQTQIGPIIVSSRKKRLTSSAGINLGAIVTKTKGNATHITHIKGIIITLVAVSYIFYDSIELGNFYGDLFGLITAFGLACNAVIARFAKNIDLVPSAVIGKLCVAIFAYFFVDTFSLVGTDLIFVPLMCVMCVAIPFVLVTIAPRFIPAEEVNRVFLLAPCVGPCGVG